MPKGAKIGEKGGFWLFTTSYKYWLEYDGQIKKNMKKCEFRVCLPTWKNVCA